MSFFDLHSSLGGRNLLERFNDEDDMYAGLYISFFLFLCFLFFNLVNLFLSLF